MTKMFEYLSIFLGIDIDKIIDDVFEENYKLYNNLKKIKSKKRKRKGMR